jgi:hypothetical protein
MLTSAEVQEIERALQEFRAEIRSALDGRHDVSAQARASADS